MAHRRHIETDPLASATALLRRLGFATLMLLIPSVALVSRRAVVVLAPIGIALLVIAAILDGENRPLARSSRMLTGSVPVLATFVLLVWIALSLIWTPFQGSASGRVTSLIATAALGLAGYLAMPERMRASNIYLLAIGVAIGACAGLLMGLAHAQDFLDVEGGWTLDRGLLALAILVWPAVAWLSSRRRDVQALLLAAAVGAACVFAPSHLPLLAFVAGAVVCILATAVPRAVAHVLAKGMAALLLLAPLVALSVGVFADGAAGGLAGSLAAWRNVITDEPLRLLTGYGIEASLRSRAAGTLSQAVPNSLFFEIWYELGLVGAVAAAVALHGAVMAAADRHPPLTPGAMATFAAAFAMAGAGVATTQMWWVTTLIAIGLVFIAIARGQFRTKRPKVLLPLLGER
jgi:hypothetical protein